MNGQGQSDRPVVPTNAPNNAGRPVAEEREGRGLAKGNLGQQTALRAQDRGGASQALERVREVAKRDKTVRFTTPLHHVYAVEQGGSISPLLANVYLHFVFDLWAQRWRKTQAHGDVIVVRYADDFIVGFEHRAEAERFLTELREQMAQFRLELHPEKTRLLQFGRFAAERRQRAGKGKPETFNFLGFTHICGETRNGRFAVVRQTIRQRLQAALREVKTELRRRLHDPIPVVGAWLRQVIRGHTQYYGVPRNGPAIAMFRFQVGELWRRALARRSQTGQVAWDRMRRLIERWLPMARICHPYPDQRLGVRT